jgi:hypothetical protein
MSAERESYQVVLTLFFLLLLRTVSHSANLINKHLLTSTKSFIENSTYQ